MESISPCGRQLWTTLGTLVTQHGTERGSQLHNKLPEGKRLGTNIRTSKIPNTAFMLF
jgi:hypothetical protein